MFGKNGVSSGWFWGLEFRGSATEPQHFFVRGESPLEFVLMDRSLSVLLIYR